MICPMKVSLNRSFRLESARSLPNLPKDHPCAAIHGHSFLVKLGLSGEIDPHIGWLMDYDDIERAFAPIKEALDHRYLNEVKGLENPTSELLAAWIYQQLKDKLPLLDEVSIMETPDTCATYRPF